MVLAIVLRFRFIHSLEYKLPLEYLLLWSIVTIVFTLGYKMDSSLNLLRKKAEKDLDNTTYKSTIVVVEDSDIDANIIKEVLSPLYVVKHFSTAEAMLEHLSELTVSLFLFDYKLPGLDGIGLCQHIRGLTDYEHTPIVMLTGEAYANFEHKFWDAGCNDFIAKPYSATTLQKRLAKELKYNALLEKHKEASMIDSLTQVFNRRYLEVVMQQLSARHESPEVSVLLLDIDYFKKYNDRYGHLAGDAALVVFTDAVKEALGRKTDFISRWGGEEFAVVLPHTNYDGCVLVANRIMQILCEERIQHEDSPTGYLTVSIGGVMVNETPKDWKTLFLAADKNLYEAKEQGRNQHVLKVQ
ncbi:diguanylate cyclase [Alteromonas sediminis]|uniref:diguanylate cyclase n=1 Tax=Alteromonas sediminis TaxID=2259342 RepID=A0A3N5Y3I9_9ALTE|nr:diguanylate cyclase [Alteromonas sediminis]RPJ67386.1 diguanylate cyclase [Alteromonas sediminis]